MGRDRRADLGLLTGDAAGHAPLDVVADAALTMLAAAAGDEADDVDQDELPEVLALLAEVIEPEETGIVATADLADRIGWDAKALGEALHRLNIASPRPPRQPIGGAKHAASVQGIDAIISAIVERSGQ